MSEDLNKLSTRLDLVETKMDAILDALKNASDTRKNNATIIDNNFQILDDKIVAIDLRIGDLHKDTNKNFKDVKFELVKIQKTTDYDSLYQNLKIVGGK